MILDIDFVSDFVCPWCFLGKTRLARALEQVRDNHPDLEVRVNWLPFFLNPDTPAAGEPYRPFLEAKFGGRRGADEVLARVVEAAAPDGLQFAFDRIATRPHTLLAHRLTYRAQSQGHTTAQINALGEALFAAHFQQGRDIGDIATLIDIAVETAGDRREDVEAYLESDEDAATVKRMAAQLQKQGVSGVPFFIFNRRLAVSGAQTSAALGAAVLQSLQNA
ncbi:Predicted dithiol-disulfide isomerase, DsbA family [Aromatoleum tolulyticum]|uniref:Predicted dithiol-disulfide isomerase, DsbA family n=1 Tax=Aromatoleum tolulyticum TaxID=34027 RepID=A0A1N6ZHH0_9RHOO|nr:DsbA family oxidoreductase [Aromatoleum tolulyticum]SIR26255.1 Predicted dithiol-disulfide isomerase, DsbA family [Aromatoleum tolulyticum]